MGINFKLVSPPAIDLKTERLSYKSVSGDDLLEFKVDRVVSLERETPCWMVGQVVMEDSISEKWIKNGREIEDSKELTDNRYILPMSQWGEEE